MPKPRQPPSAFHLKEPSEVTSYLAADGSPLELLVYVCSHNNIEYVRCSICDGFVPRGKSGQTLITHQKTAICSTTAQKRAQSLEQIRTEKALQTLHDYVSEVNTLGA